MPYKGCCLGQGMKGLLEGEFLQKGCKAAALWMGSSDYFSDFERIREKTTD